MMRLKTWGVLALAVVLGMGTMALADTGSASDSRIQSKLSEQFSQDKSLWNVHPRVKDGVVTLEGSVRVYRDKLNAEKKAHKAGKVSAVRDLVEVGGPQVSDAALTERLADQLRYDRYGFGHVFNLLTVGVNDGVVTLGGEVRSPADRASAVALVESTPGVRGVVDQVKVAPLSTYDDGLRLRVLRAIYGDPFMLKYAMDPQAPIRVVVDNGHVALYGVVDNKMDKQIAGMRASGVFGAFSVENHLTTANGVNK